MSKFTSVFIKSYDEDSDKGYILKADPKYRNHLRDLHNDLRFLPERIKTNKCNKLICNLNDKNKYVVHIKLLKQALNHGLILKKVHRVISFDQEARMKHYTMDNIGERKKERREIMILKKIFIK